MIDLKKDDKENFLEKSGDVWDKATLNYLLNGNSKEIYNRKSLYQDIVILEVPDIRMYLDEQLQFSSVDEKFYHEALVHPAMFSLSNCSNVLILGGGDGFALREVLKYPEVKHVDLVELDPMVIKLAKSSPIVKLNKGSLKDKRVHIHEMDAQDFFSNDTPLYQLIIVDFPDPQNDDISKLYTKEFFSRISQYLDKDGILVCQSHSPEDAPRVYWSIGLTLQSTGLTTCSYQTYVPSFGMWGYHLASKNKDAAFLRKSNSIPTDTLPDDLSSLYHFPKSILEEKEHAVVNTLSNLTLHEIYIEDIYED
ncbi:spermine/spermidine synthase domain-containing protein [Bacillus timonensis]|uniref:spermine/spermidine synthase domain-containing protein n=1 Tax=Bacillus timonensis TaxID=1033734 RepID=UPI0006936D23